MRWSMMPCKGVSNAPTQLVLALEDAPKPACQVTQPSEEPPAPPVQEHPSTRKIQVNCLRSPPPVESLVCLEIFAGTCRLSSALAVAFQALAVDSRECKTFRLLQFDLLQPSSRAPVFELIRTRRIFYVHAAPCSMLALKPERSRCRGLSRNGMASQACPWQTRPGSLTQISFTPLTL